jgi:uncharacterized protein
MKFFVLQSILMQSSGANMNQSTLHTAAKTDDVAAIKDLLSKGAAIDARDANGCTALLVATHGNKVNAARALIAAGSDVNSKDNIHDSPYLYAGASGYIDILKMTLAHEADLKRTNRYGGTALIPASERGHVETVCTLIEAGVDVDHDCPARGNYANCPVAGENRSKGESGRSRRSHAA